MKRKQEKKDCSGSHKTSDEHFGKYKIGYSFCYKKFWISYIK